MDNTQTTTAPALLTPDELRERWRITKRHLSRLHNAGLPHIRLPAHTVRYDPVLADQWLRSREQETAR
jgi:hypothetical protein